MTPGAKSGPPAYLNPEEEDELVSYLMAVHRWVMPRAVRYHLKFVYHDTIVRVSRYTLGIDTSHDMGYMR